jgi:hypothetical protein
MTPQQEQELKGLLDWYATLNTHESREAHKVAVIAKVDEMMEAADTVGYRRGFEDGRHDNE